MTKKEIADQLCSRVPNLTKSMAIHAVDAISEILTDAFQSGQSIYLRGFGTFAVKTSAPKTARNITKGTAVYVPARRTVKLKLSKTLKNRLNNAPSL